MPDDEAHIIGLHRGFAAAWNRGDAEGVANLFADDAVRVGVAGDTQHGRPEIRAAMARVLTQIFPGATVEVEGGSVRFLAPDVALWRGAMEIRPAGGLPALRGYSIDVMKKVGDRWLILETHPKLFPPPPPPAPGK